MPNPRDMQMGLQVAGAVLERMAPEVCARLAAVLPEIFGGSASAAAVFRNAPRDVALMEQLGLSYRAKLESLALPSTTKPSELFIQAIKAGAKPLVNVGGGQGYGITDQQITFHDGTRLTRLVSGGRALSSDSTTFISADNSTMFSHEKGSFMGSHHEKWTFKTPSASGSVDVVPTPHAGQTQQLSSELMTLRI